MNNNIIKERNRGFCSGLRAYSFPFKETGDQLSFPWFEATLGNGFNVWDFVFDDLRPEGAKNKPSKISMVCSLVKENCLLPQHPLFASRKCWFEELSFVQYKLCCFRVRNHHTRITQNVWLEYRAIPIERTKKNKKRMNN